MLGEKGGLLASGRGKGLYDPRFERDACGIGFVAQASGTPSRFIVDSALEALCRVRHRGAVAADHKSGDGAGLLLPIAGQFFADRAVELGFEVGEPRRVGVAMAFLAGRAAGEGRRGLARRILEEACRAESLDLLGWRKVPVALEALGDSARAEAPSVEQALLVRPAGVGLEEAERRCFRARKRAEAAARSRGVRLYLASVSFRTVTYKAMCAADQLAAFYPDLGEPGLEAAFCIFHQRYSTNTTPSWERAQPFRFLCHNGEINTIQGNVNWMRARESRLGSGELAAEALLSPVIDESGSDSTMLDNALELLVRGGRDIRHALAMLIPEAWEGSADIDPAVRDFYRYHSALMEPWDGPAGIIFTDGVRVGAHLDRNGLRPLRYAVCEDGFVACASEAGAVDVHRHGMVRRGKLGPGQILCVDPENGGVETDAAVKARLATRQPYGRWVEEHLKSLDCGAPSSDVPTDLVQRQVVFGYTKEEFTYVLRPMAVHGKEPTFSMGDDTPPAILAQRRRPLYGYFKQRFAQVTNPAIDHLRERLVMSLRTCLGRRAPLLSEEPEAAQLLELETFLLFPSGLEVLAGRDGPLPRADLDATFPIGDGPAGLQAACERLAGEAEAAIRNGAALLVISDRNVGAERAPVPALLATGAVHHHLVRIGLRTLGSLVLDTDEAREVHHFACLLGYGADAVCPRLALQSIAAISRKPPQKISDFPGTPGTGRGGPDSPDPIDAQRRFVNAVEDGVLKVLTKMGISTLESYRGAQIFEAVGLGRELIDQCFTGTPSPMGGITFHELGEEAILRHSAAYGAPPRLESPGFFKHHKTAIEYHTTHPQVVKALHETLGIDAAADPESEESGEAAPVPVGVAAGNDGSSDVAAQELRAAHALQRAVKAGSTDGYALYERFAQLVNTRPPAELRDLLEMVPAGPPLPIECVEPAGSILRRFSTGAMSHGSIGAEAHETIAIAMNRLGARSNTGEGGEDPYRYRTRGTDKDRNSRIKQVASGRFGVTPEYCVFADELQIKIAQGSKPGEGGQIPGHKVTEEIARLRHTQPWVALISPPPHHDIYSIEDLAQLIFDLKQVNPLASVSVKLVAEMGVGTIAAGVVKGLADVVHIAGGSGGTGASPLSSIKNAGLPWEVGLAETQQTLRRNGLRGRVRLRVDGGLKSGRDVMMAALLGADEYAFGTAALLAEGCIMVRTCHLDTCPAGIATQRPELRAKFAGTPEMVMAYMTYVAEEVRRILAALGLRSLDEAIGRVDLLRPRPADHGRSERLDLTPVLADGAAGPRRFTGSLPIQRPSSSLGDQLCAEAVSALREGRTISLHYRIGNGDRAVGARLGGVIAHEFGTDAPPGQVTVHFEGEAGQSFGAFLTDGIEFVLTGEANDYLAKGMGGGRLVIRPPLDDAGDPHLIGNTVLYGATGGELLCAGRAGERFAIRNSGATAVVEGAGDHACEYMTGGTVIILGPVGNNLGAGMTGGEVFVYDPGIGLPTRVNRDLVDAHRLIGDHHLLAEQGIRLRHLIERYAAATGSARARSILEDWRSAIHAFWRVAPKADVARIERQHEGTVAARA